MEQYKITGPVLKEMILAAAGYLEKNKTGLDALNVFPVPDGDTGTNMSMTMMSAAREVQACDSPSVAKVAAAASMGALKGARGNSGVILSQILRGFAKGMDGIHNEVYAAQLANAMDAGVKAAYKAVMKPKEGTILTVAREMAAEAVKLADRGADTLTMLERVLEVGEKTLLLTPEMLPVLKEAGVVDAGGKGLLVIYHAFKMVLDGDDMAFDFDSIAPAATVKREDTGSDLEFRYCTEFFIKNVHEGVAERDIERLREKLAGIGDCVLVVGDLSLIKVHVHTNMPGKALQLALRFGELSGIKIDNMSEQHNEIINVEPEQKKPMAVVSVSAGDGLNAVFADLGTDHIVEGGQTMNPSAADIADAIKHTRAQNVIILPNNKNIILAAQQAASLVDCTVYVVDSKSIPQGIAAMLALNPDLDAQENYKRMQEAISAVKTGQVTHAVRPAKVNGFTIEEGEILGMMNGDIVVHGHGLEDIAFELIGRMVGEDDCVITTFYGEEVSEEEGAAFGAKLAERYPDMDIEVQRGGQPVYQYIFSVE